MEESKNKKYAGQIIDIARTDKRLSFTDLLQKIEDRHDTPFLNIFAPQSIYLATLFTFNEQESVTANIPLKDISLIARKTDFAEELIFQMSSDVQMIQENEEDGQDKPDPAFLPLRIGKLAGKAPGDLLLESPNVNETVAALKSQMEFLQKGVQKYPNNRQDIQSIAQALDYHAMGILNSCKPKTVQKVTPATSKTYVIYETPVKHQKRMEAGKNLCYSIKVTCVPAKKYPYHFEIMNCWAPLGTAKNGMKPVLMDQATEINRKDIDLTEEEWICAVDIMKNNIAEARHLWYPEMRTCDARNRWRNRNQ